MLEMLLLSYTPLANILYSCFLLLVELLDLLYYDLLRSVKSVDIFALRNVELNCYRYISIELTKLSRQILFFFVCSNSSFKYFISFYYNYTNYSFASIDSSSCFYSLSIYNYVIAISNCFLKFL
jgi:hypothetical protein